LSAGSFTLIVVARGENLKKVPVSDVCMSVVTKSELMDGVEVSPRRQQDEAALNAFLNYVEVLDFPDNASSHSAQIRAQLKKSGNMIGANHLFVAAHARSLGLTLVTHNTQEFRQVHKLAIEDWTLGG
jgi:tRNA(fMet)-specific endonuclease VapC